MANFSTPAIMLKSTDFGDYDLIATFITPGNGRISALAKYAKKSKKRFAGILELFSVLDLVCDKGRGKLPVIREATLICPYPGIREDIKKIAFASYWAEMVINWVQGGDNKPDFFILLKYVLDSLDSGDLDGEELSIIFQVRFLSISGLMPHMNQCVECRKPLDHMPGAVVAVDPARGGILCDSCCGPGRCLKKMSKGAVKNLIWIEKTEMEKASRVRPSPADKRDSLDFLETFVLYHLGKELNSLKFMKKIRRTCL